MSTTFVYSQCPVCNNGKYAALYKINYSSNRVLEFLKISDKPTIQILKCNICLHHFASPIINSELLEEYYSKLNSEYFINEIPQNHLEHRHDYFVKLLDKVIDRKGKVLEIGCGYGFLLNKFQNDGWDAYGIEPSPKAAEFIKRNFPLIKIYNTYLSKISFARDYFDVIVLMDVIEHLSEPNHVLSEIKSVLRTNGILIVGTGNINSLNSRLSCENWGYFGSWEHISFFSPSSIKYLLHKNSFDIIKLIKLSNHGTKYENLINIIKNFFIITKNHSKIILQHFIKNKFTQQKTPLAFDHMLILAKKHE